MPRCPGPGLGARPARLYSFHEPLVSRQ